MRIKVAVLNHNEPERTENIHEFLRGAFDEVEIIDSGSDSDKVPAGVTIALPNVYWTGAWNELLARYSDWDAIWMLPDDIEFKNTAEEYRQAIETAMPFGCWSPCIEGRAHPFMKAENFVDGLPLEVINSEGMTLAVSGELARDVQKLVEGSAGYGQDFWLCFRSRKMGLRNILDGRVRIFHEEEIRYDDEKWLAEMNEVFGHLYGPNFREEIFEYREDFQGNTIRVAEVGEMKITVSEAPEALKGPSLVAPKKEPGQLTLITVDNGWGIPEFERIARKFPGLRKLVLRKGLSFRDIPGMTVVEGDEGKRQLLEDGDIALFTKVGDANVQEYKEVLDEGIPVIVREMYSQNLIDHEKTGFLYGHESWAEGWVKELSDSSSLRMRTRSARLGMPVPDMIPVKKTDAAVSVISPTWKRDGRVISRCVDCLKLQTMNQWEQLLCSNGPHEAHVSQLIDRIGDGRVIYSHTENAQEGDFGNVARKEMLEKVLGKYVMFFDDDNIVFPNYMERMIAALEESGADFAVCRVMHFGPLNEGEVGVPPKVLSGNPVKLHHIDPLQVMVKTEVMKEIGWDTEVGYLSDGHTLQALGEKFTPVHIDDILGIHM